MCSSKQSTLTTNHLCLMGLGRFATQGSSFFRHIPVSQWGTLYLKAKERKFTSSLRNHHPKDKKKKKVFLTGFQ